ncbi:MAG: hypothetical protein ACM359_21105 [Bacillota bacterium]
MPLPVPGEALEPEVPLRPLVPPAAPEVVPSELLVPTLPPWLYPDWSPAVEEVPLLLVPPPLSHPSRVKLPTASEAARRSL